MVTAINSLLVAMIAIAMAMLPHPAVAAVLVG